MRIAFLCLACLVGPICTGCGTTSTGWRFEVGRPSVMTVPMSIQQTSGDLLVGGVATGVPTAVAHNQRTLAATVANVETLPPPRSVGPRSSRSALAISEDCSLEEMCRLLRAIDDRLFRSQTQQLEMPKGRTTGTRPCD